MTCRGAQGARMERWIGDSMTRGVYKPNYWGCDDVRFVELLEKQWDYRCDQCINTIPRIIHFIWLGGDLPQKYQAAVDSWRRFHSSWSIRIWTDACVVGELSGDMLTHYHNATNYGMKSDILRYHVRYERSYTL